MEKFISEEVVDSICSQLSELSLFQQKLFSIVLHGGEPLLLGPARLEDLLGKLRRVLSFDYPISIQTNGTLITNHILDVCSKYKVSVAVSIDGPKSVHDKFRVTHQGAGTFDEVIKGINKLNSHPDALFLNAGALAVVHPESNPKEVYAFFKSIDTPSVDFLYKDGNHVNLPLGKSVHHSTEYGTWMKRLLDVYLADTNPLPIRVLDDMLKVLLGGIVSKEGLGVTDFGILVIDTDGTFMKNDTLKSSFNGADKFSVMLNIRKHRLLEFLQSVEFREYREMQRPTSRKCLECPELDVCGGGMILHRWSTNNGFDNPSIYCADQLYLIQNMRKTLSVLTEQYA